MQKEYCINLIFLSAMSYDLGFNPKKSRDDEARQPLLNQDRTKRRIDTGISSTEVMEHLDKVSNNIRKLKKFSNDMNKTTSSIYDPEIMAETTQHLMKSKDLLEKYNKPDKESFTRKFNVLRTQFEEVIEEIKVKLEHQKVQSKQQVLNNTEYSDEEKDGKRVLV